MALDAGNVSVFSSFISIDLMYGQLHSALRAMTSLLGDIYLLCRCGKCHTKMCQNVICLLAVQFYRFRNHFSTGRLVFWSPAAMEHWMSTQASPCCLYPDCQQNTSYGWESMYSILYFCGLLKSVIVQ